MLEGVLEILASNGSAPLFAHEDRKTIYLEVRRRKGSERQTGIYIVMCAQFLDGVSRILRLYRLSGNTRKSELVEYVKIDFGKHCIISCA